MTKSVVSLEDFYRTQPPQYMESAKISSVLEFLAFSGSPIYLSIEKSAGRFAKIESAASVVDVGDTDFLLECKDLKWKGDFPVGVQVSFGYKRKRAFFQTQIVGIDKDLFRVASPAQLTLTNLRRNPRVLIDPDTMKKGLKVNLLAQTSVGTVELKRVEAFEMSQLGLSVFIDRNEGLVLPGDRVERIEIYLRDELIFQSEGLISRVDMKRRSSVMPQSYEAVVLFRKAPPKKDKSDPVVRAARRTPILDDKPCFFTAEHPLFPGRSIQGQVFEVSSSGLSCMLERTSFPIVEGMRFHKCQLQLPHKPPRDFVFDVHHVEFRSDGQANEFRIGGEFTKAPIELIKDISAYSQDVAGNLVKDVTEEDLDLLWEFMFETNFIYQDKRRLLQGRSKEILQTYHRLMSTDNPIVKKLVMKEDNEIKGHVSAIHFYDHAWIIQHLNALKSSSTSAAQQVVSSIVNFFYDAKAMQKADIFYVMSFYRPNNVYPAVLFGETAKRIGDPLKSVAFDLSYGLYHPSEVNDESRQRVEGVVVDRPDDMLRLSNYLIERNMIAFMRACGLSHPQELDMKLKSIYQNQSLFRDRHILSIQEDGAWAVAMVEESSPGLNLSELTNSIFVMTEGDDLAIQSRLASAVVSRAHDLFFEPRGVSPVVLQLPDAPKADNVAWSKFYTCWLTSAAGVADFEKHSRDVVSELKDLIGQFKRDSHGESDGQKSAG